MPVEEPPRYDFVVVGAGPAGCALARDLAYSPARPSVLLLEAGPANADTDKRMLFNRFSTLVVPGMDHGYAAAPNPHMDGREQPLWRGRGLGGTSAINFGFWTEGAAADWDRIAGLLADDAWSWNRVKPRFFRLTTHHCATEKLHPNTRPLVRQPAGTDGHAGPLHIGYADPPEAESVEVLAGIEAAGVPFRPDANAGALNSAVFLHPDTFYRGMRSTAADLVHDPPGNLAVLTDTPIARVVLSGNRAVGVEAVDGRVFRAAREVVLCAGTMDSPRILMHSGIGPADQLAAHGVPLARAAPHVGANLTDHLLAVLRFPGRAQPDVRGDHFRDPAARAAALRSWQLHRAGPYTTIGGTIPMAFFPAPAPLLASPEFAALPATERALLADPATPVYEIAWGNLQPEYVYGPTDYPPIFSFVILPQYLQSRGRFSLRSADPREPLAFDTAFLSHPYDRRCVIEATRETLGLFRKGTLPGHFRSSSGGGDILLDAINAPASDSDEDILAFWRREAGPGLHVCGTCRIGVREAEDEAVVGKDFRVFGFQGLRVADNSIWPWTPAAHIQAHAYQVGMIAAEKLIAEHNLSSP